MRERPATLAELGPEQVLDALQPYRLPKPERFLLMLVEAAHLWPGCVGIELDFIAYPARVVLRGARLEPEQLRTCLDDLLRAERPELDAPLRARRRLGAALFGAVEALSKPVQLLGYGPRSACLTLSPTGELHFGLLDGASEAPRVELRLPSIGGDVYARLLARVRRGARFGGLSLKINGEALRQGPASVEVLEALNIRDAELGHIGYLGWSIRCGLREHGVLVLSANGVAVEILELPGLPQMMCAAVDARSLARAPNLVRFVRDQRFERLRRAVLRAAPLAPLPAPVRVDIDRSARLGTLALGLLGLSMFGLGLPLGATGLVLLGLPGTAGISASLALSRRTQRLRAEGELRIALVEGVGLGLVPELGGRVFRVRVRVQHPDRRTEIKHMLTTDLLSAGMRVFVRLHPDKAELALAALPELELLEDE